MYTPLPTPPSTPRVGTERRRALSRTALLDFPAEAAFDRVTRVVARALRVPMALSSLVYGHRQLFKSFVGVPQPWVSGVELPLAASPCQHVVAHAAPFVVPDARAHPLVRELAFVDAVGAGAYLGVPLLTADRQVFGTLCAVDRLPRPWTEDEIALLSDLARGVVCELELRVELRDGESRRAELRRAADAGRRARALVDGSADAMMSVDADARITLWNPAAEATFGYEAREVLGRDFTVLVPRHYRARQRERFLAAAAAGPLAVPRWGPALARRRNGEEFPVDVSVGRLEDAGALASFGVVIRDLSARRPTEGEAFLL